MCRSSLDPLDWTFERGHRAGKKMIELDTETQCWIWQGHLHAGYGVMTYSSKEYPGISVGRRATDRITKAVSAERAGKVYGSWKAIMPHQFFYCLKYGNPPEGTELAHSCHRRSCCSPEHVRPKSHAENTEEKFLHPDDLPPWTSEGIEESLQCDLPVHKVAFDFCVPVYTVVTLLSRLKTGQLDLSLPWEQTPF